jgi:hypothetical protein
MVVSVQRLLKAGQCSVGRLHGPDKQQPQAAVIAASQVEHVR